MPPDNPISAVIHSNPYPFYADLALQKPFYYGETLKLWVAASAEAVNTVLTSELCRVRPLIEPVPRLLLDSPAADIFQHLVRMNEGENHCPVKRMITTVLSSVDTARVNTQSERWSQRLLSELQMSNQPQNISQYAFQLPVHVMGSLLGIPDDRLAQTAVWINDFVRCIAPGSSLEQIEQGKHAAGALIQLFQSLLAAPGIMRGDSLLIAMQQAGGNARLKVMIANAIGFLSQTYEATAGLIGNTLLALNTQQETALQVKDHPALLPHFIQEVLRYDAPVQNTRRFVVQEGQIGGQTVKNGDTILVILAAANWDARANPNPAHFDLYRKTRKIFTFGSGVHTCPGESLAALIAQAAVEAILASDFDWHRLTDCVTYRVSANTRIPLFNL